jgi:cell division protein FtsB
MPPARSASARAAAARTSTPRATTARPTTARAAAAAASAERRRAHAQPARAPRRVALRAPHLRVRWERVGRVALLVVLAVVIGLYADHAISFFTARAQDNRQHAVVTQLKRQNTYFEQRQRSLNDLSAILAQARKLGMVRPGEQPYTITGQPAR